jgi:hypothetical protein
LVDGKPTARLRVRTRTTDQVHRTIRTRARSGPGTQAKPACRPYRFDGYRRLLDDWPRAPQNRRGPAVCSQLLIKIRAARRCSQLSPVGLFGRGRPRGRGRVGHRRAASIFYHCGCHFPWTSAPSRHRRSPYSRRDRLRSDRRGPLGHVHDHSGGRVLRGVRRRGVDTHPTSPNTVHGLRYRARRARRGRRISKEQARSSKPLPGSNLQLLGRPSSAPPASRL